MSIDPGDGFRLLQAGERLQEGDQFHAMYDEWVNVYVGRFGETITDNHCVHRRRMPRATGIEAIVCADIAERQRLGVAKYGTTVADNPLTLKEWLTHAYQECLDQAVYLRKAIDELEA
jgi:hypothetical protein